MFITFTLQPDIHNTVKQQLTLILILMKLESPYLPADRQVGSSAETISDSLI
ncbi:MAG TPA: hypothetical protein VFI29_03815 [Hanamia sp.]|nr:hypothetical protein [Hanamia sp.]